MATTVKPKRTAKKKLDITPTREDLKKYRKLATPWAEDLPHQIGRTDGQLVLEHKSFQAWIDEHAKWLQLPMPLPARGLQLPNGCRVTLRKLTFNEVYYPTYGGFPLPFIAPSRVTKTCLPMYYGGREAYRVTFDGDVDVLMLVKKDGEPWMSLVPNEIFTQRTGIKRARGNVLLAGLGLGWLARRVLERPQVKHLTIVDCDQDVLDTFGTPFRNDSRVTLVHADAYDYLGVNKTHWKENTRVPASLRPDHKISQFDSILFDIWATLNGVGDDRNWACVVDNAKNAWGWGTRREF